MPKTIPGRPAPDPKSVHVWTSFLSINDGLKEIKKKFDNKNKVAIIFGPENSGLSNSDLTLVDRLITFNSNPKFSSINLSHSVILFCYEWNKFINHKHNHRKMKQTILANKKELLNFYHRLEMLLSKSGFIKTEQRKKTITNKLRNIFNRMDLTKNELDALMGIMNSLYRSRWFIFKSIWLKKLKSYISKSWQEF